jgi:hypothetical protein
MFYEPHINMDLTDPSDYTSGGALARLYIPDGDGYSYATFVDTALDYTWTVTPYPNGVAGTAVNLTTNDTGSSTTLDLGEVMVNFTGSGNDLMDVYIMDAAETSRLIDPAVIMFEEKDDNNQYQAVIVKMDAKSSSTDLVGVADVETTWNNDGANTDWDELQMEASDDDLYASYDFWGTYILTDTSDSDQYSADISYPDEQVNAQVYIAEEGATITAGSSGQTATPLGEVLVKDSEVSSVSSKNLVIVGGSCINSAAATVLGGAYCGPSFTTATGVGSGQFLIKGYTGTSVTSKLALVVAGYDAADTVNAATYLRTQVVDTSKEYLGTSSTSATLVTETA